MVELGPSNTILMPADPIETSDKRYDETAEPVNDTLEHLPNLPRLRLPVACRISSKVAHTIRSLRRLKPGIHEETTQLSSERTHAVLQQLVCGLKSISISISKDINSYGSAIDITNKGGFPTTCSLMHSEFVSAVSSSLKSTPHLPLRLERSHNDLRQTRHWHRLPLSMWARGDSQYLDRGRTRLANLSGGNTNTEGTIELLGNKTEQFTAASRSYTSLPKKAQKLPPEILLAIFFYLTQPKDIRCVQLTCRYWYLVGDTALVILWRHYPYAGMSILEALRRCLSAQSRPLTHSGAFRQRMAQLSHDYIRCNPDVVEAFYPVDPLDFVCPMIWTYLLIDLENHTHQHSMKSTSLRGLDTTSNHLMQPKSLLRSLFSRSASIMSTMAGIDTHTLNRQHFVNLVQNEYPQGQNLERRALEATYIDICNNPIFAPNSIVDVTPAASSFEALSLASTAPLESYHQRENIQI